MVLETVTVLNSFSDPFFAPFLAVQETVLGVAPPFSAFVAILAEEGRFVRLAGDLIIRQLVKLRFRKIIERK